MEFGDWLLFGACWLVIGIFVALSFWLHLKKLDWILIGAVFALCLISLLTLYSVNFGKPGMVFFNKQAVFIALGLAVMLAISYFDFRIFKNYPSFLLVIYLAGLGILLLTLVFGRVTRGSISWLRFGELGFEPVELMKLIIILILAKYFSLRHVEMYRIRHVIASGIYVILPSVLILMQPDLGSVMILVAIWIGVVILTGIKLRHLILVLIGGIVVFTVAWSGALKPYQKDRILTFINPQRDPFGASYNLIQSKIAVGSGGLVGQGLGQGTQGRLDFLPEKHTDFIFSAFAEEWGFVGVIFLLAIYGLLFFRLIRISLQSQNNFARLFSAGVCLMIFSEAFINIGVTLGLLPITGLSLPFVSYGGSGLLMHFVALGVVQSIVVRNK